MKKIFFIAVMILSTPVYAIDLLSVYQQALENDPILKQAGAERDATKETFPQSRAALLPNLSASANTAFTRTSAGRVNSITGLREGDGYNNHSYGIKLSQPILAVSSWMNLRSASDIAKQADATYAAALQDLIIRVASAYFNVLQAQDNLRYTQAQKVATGTQLKQIKERYEVGLGTMTDVYQAQASYDALTAQEISAKNDIANSLEALRQITGKNYASLVPVHEKFPFVMPEPNDPLQWINAAEKQNWILRAAHYAQLSARENVHANYAEHLPTVAAVGQYQKGNNLSSRLISTNQEQWASTVGVEVNLPLFQGGYQVSKVREAQDKYASANDHLEATHRQVILETQQAFNNIIASISKIQADQLAITSAQSALDSTRAGFKAGTKTVLDVLTAEQNLYHAQTNYSTDQYAYIINTFTLKKAVGVLCTADVQQINQWLQE